MKINQYKDNNILNLLPANNYQISGCNRIHFTGKSKYDFLDEFAVSQETKENIILKRIEDMFGRLLCTTIDSGQKFVMNKASNNQDLQESFSDILQPVSNETVKAIKNKKQQAKKLGIKVNFAYHTDSAEELISGLIRLQEAGYPLPKKIRIFESFISELHKDTNIAAIHRIFKRKNIEFISKENIFENLKHEMGHFLHSMRDYKLYKYLALNNIEFKPEYKELIRKELLYEEAATNPAEFVAEAFRKQVNGRTLSNELLDLYNKLKGPVIKGILH